MNTETETITGAEALNALAQAAEQIRTLAHHTAAARLPEAAYLSITRAWHSGRRWHPEHIHESLSTHSEIEIAARTYAAVSGQRFHTDDLYVEDGHKNLPWNRVTDTDVPREARAAWGAWDELARYAVRGDGIEPHRIRVRVDALIDVVRIHRDPEIERLLALNRQGW